MAKLIEFRGVYGKPKGKLPITIDVTPENDERDKRGYYKTANEPSPLLTWYIENDAKRRRGELNEIDLADIRAAFSGVKNIWLKVVLKHPGECLKFLTSQDEAEWKNLLALRQQQS